MFGHKKIWNKIIKIGESVTRALQDINRLKRKTTLYLREEVQNPVWSGTDIMGVNRPDRVAGEISTKKAIKLILDELDMELKHEDEKIYLVNKEDLE